MNQNKFRKPLSRVLIMIIIILLSGKIVLCGNASNTQKSKERQKAKEHLEEVKKIGVCALPKPELIYISDATNIFNPRATVLHRCSNRSGCCANMDHSCQAVDTENVTLYFFVTRQSPKTTTVKCVRMINHTKCECVKISDTVDDDLYYRSQNVFEFTTCPHNEFSHLELSPQTFRPKKKFEVGTLRYSLHKQAIASLNSGINLRDVVRLPSGEDMFDWIAVHVVDFFNRINLIYGTVTDYCTVESCPRMSGGHKYEYLWADGNKFKKPTPLPAPTYVALLMDWIETQINNESIFPTKTDVPFPKTFATTCKKILARLFRVFVHVYIHHFDRLLAIGAEVHCNACFKHFYYFVTHFDLVSQKELEPLADLTKKLCCDAKPENGSEYR